MKQEVGHTIINSLKGGGGVICKILYGAWLAAIQVFI